MSKHDLYEYLKSRDEELAQKLTFLKKCYFNNELSDSQISSYHAIHDETSLNDFKLDDILERKFQQYKEEQKKAKLGHSIDLDEMLAEMFGKRSLQNDQNPTKNNFPRVLDRDKELNFKSSQKIHNVPSITPKDVKSWNSGKKNIRKSCKQYHFENDVLTNQRINDNYSEEPCPFCGKFYPISYTSRSVCGNGRDASARDDENNYGAIQDSYIDNNWL